MSRHILPARGRSACIVAAAIAVLSLFAFASSQAAAPDAKAPKHDAASSLVKSALDAELAGDAARRNDLLTKARKASPGSANAHWQSGQVFFNGAWRTAEEVASLVSHDDRWTQYRELRDQSTDTPDDHYRLARWCGARGLKNEERFHWASLLLQVPDHKEARERLDLREFDGGLYTGEQIDRMKADRVQAKKNLDRFKPTFLDIRRRAATTDMSARETALDELRRVSNPGAIQSLDEVTNIAGSYKSDLVRKLGRDGADKFILDFNLAGLAALGNMPQHEATVRLANCVVASPWLEARCLSARLLKVRPKTDYVPMLMAQLTAPIEADFSLSAGLDGTVNYGETIRQRGPEARRSAVRTEDVSIVQEENNRGEMNSPLPAQAAAYQRLAAVAIRKQQEIAVANANAAAVNSRIAAALKMTTGFDVDLNADPEVWWQAWRDDNELYYSEDDQPVYETAESSTQYYYVPPPGMMSCFPAGTPVWTEAGPVAIETIQVGDMVLSQQPTTGELAYRPVLQTTLRPPTGTVSLKVNDETIVATLGHRFWVNGRGWEMAKLLKADAPLHSLDGPVKVAAIEASKKGEEVEAHNLGVDDFHTYFVGKSRLLVHDNSCPRPTTAAIPGMVLPAKSPRP